MKERCKKRHTFVYELRSKRQGKKMEKGGRERRNTEHEEREERGERRGKKLKII